ncbi:unnamed protein product [Triticum turgidum subsp. durum]|uniref:Wall-associated receptor kinase galacturonan-binding domain-containing protein n=1 Tax=Triticum turgidum subsp. durum TaxID=4567 RepID=A0A9R1ASN1_TRITD|nr:unnamed protein product [Triticum turgidum subsp. durum]
MSTAALLLPALLLLPSLLAATAVAEGRTITVSPTCQGSCGGVDIPYPFGIGAGCFLKGFEINCTEAGGAGPVSLIANTSIQVVSLSADPPESRVLLPIRWQCYELNVSDGKVVGNMEDTSFFNHQKNIPSQGIYRISNKHNMLFVLGCATIGIVKTFESRTLASASGCMSFCRSATAAQNGQCAGAGCCKVGIQPELTSIVFEFPNIRKEMPQMLNHSPCDYAFIVDEDNYTFQSPDLRHMDRTRTMPTRLDWAIREMPSCADAKDAADQYACKSNHSECVDSTNGTGYACKCSQGYEGNPYLVGESGCTGKHHSASLFSYTPPLLTALPPPAPILSHPPLPQVQTASLSHTPPPPDSSLHTVPWLDPASRPFRPLHPSAHACGSPPMPAISLLRLSTACGHLEEPQTKVFLLQHLQPDTFARKFTADVLFWCYLHSILNLILEPECKASHHQYKIHMFFAPPP